MKFDILKTRTMTVFAGTTPKNLELTCHSEGTNVTEESMMRHCEEVAEQPTWQSKENKILDCFAYARNDKKCKAAFTLAETMIVLVILGIVAAITIPALVRRHVESSNRTRIRKAMTVYDTAINKMVVENGIKNNDALINEFNADKNNNSCAKSRAYFKSAQDGANDCTFRASDGVWWNISDITHPIIAFNEDDLNKADEENNKAFHLVGYLDDNGSLRVSDLAKAEGDNQEYLTKLYNFVNNKKDSSGEVVQKSPFDECSEKGQDTCTVNGITYTPKQFTAQCYDFQSWADAEHKGKQSCGTAGTFWVAELGYPEDYDTQAKDLTGSTCEDDLCKEEEIGDYYNAAKRYCESSGGHLSTIGELISGGYTDGNFCAAEEYDSNLVYYLGDGVVDYLNKHDSFAVVCVGN